MPRVKDPILTEKQIDKAPIAELRKNYRILIAHYKKYKNDLASKKKSISKFKIDREEAVKRVEEKYVEKLTRVRINRDSRIGKAMWQVFKGKQTAYALRKAITKRFAPITGTRVKNKRDIIRKAKAQGFQQGLNKSYRIRKNGVYKIGYRDGQAAYKDLIKDTRRGVVRRSAIVDSIARTAILINKLADATKLPPQYVAIVLWSGEYDSFLFKELKAAMDSIGERLVYKKIYYLREAECIHKIAQNKDGAIWSLTHLGRELHNRMKAYIKGYIQEQRPN